MKYIKECLWNSLQNFHQEFHSISIFSHDTKIPWKILMTVKLSIMCYNCFMVISRNFHETTQVVIYSQKKQDLRSSRAGQSITMEFSFNWQNLISTIPLSAHAEPQSPKDIAGKWHHEAERLMTDISAMGPKELRASLFPDISSLVHPNISWLASSLLSLIPIHTAIFCMSFC